MTRQGFEAARSLVDDALELGHSFAPEEWAASSAADGWTVQDVYTHMAFFFNTIADPEVERPNNPSGRAEDLNDLSVRERAGWSAAQTMEYYVEQSAAGLAALEVLQSNDMADATLELADLGTYHLSLLADAVTFDHLVHLNSDILAPRGPVDRPPVDMGVERIEPTLNWMITGLPQMCGEELKPVLDRPVGIILTGTGGRSFVLSNEDGQVRVDESQDAASLPETQAESTAESFLNWSTRREPWNRHVTVRGDQQTVERILNAINIV